MMKIFLVTVLASVAFGTRERGNNAIKKVIQMLGDMQAKAKTEKADEEVAFAKYNQFCKMETSKLTKAVAKSASEIAALQSSISKLTEDAKKLGMEIGVLNGQIAKSEADMKARQNSRKKEHATNVAQSKDYAESISALDRAVQTLSEQNYDRKGAAAVLLQVSQMSRISQKTKDLIDAYMGSDDAGIEVTAPEANAYEFQGGSIISMMKSMNEDFRAAKTKVDKEEANAKHAHEMVMADLADTIQDAKKDVNSKTGTKSAKQEKVAMDKREKASTEAVKKEDEATLKSVDTECSEKRLSFNDKQSMRSDEIEAIGQAMQIMSGKDVSGFIQSAAVAGSQKAAASFAQMLRSSSEAAAAGKRHDVREFILRESMRLKSRSLSLLAENLQADPFAKVKGMISNMITHLTKEANEDAESEAFCDAETAKSKATRTSLTEDIDSLTASIEDSKSTVMSLAENNAELSKGIADINAAMAAATEMRTSESKTNKASVKDAKNAVKAVDAAISVLKDYYKKASQATALVQGGSAAAGIKMGSDEWDMLGDADAPAPKKHKEGMKTFGDKFTGNQDGAAGVLAMVDVIRSDFMATITDTTAAEAEAVRAYDNFTVESRKNVAMKSKKLELNEADKAAATKKMTEDTKDLKSNQESLVAAQKYFQKLQGQCTAKGSSYEERTKARAEEIQSLKEAMQMLG